MAICTQNGNKPDADGRVAPTASRHGRRRCMWNGSSLWYQARTTEMDPWQRTDQPSDSPAPFLASKTSLQCQIALSHRSCGTNRTPAQPTAEAHSRELSLKGSFRSGAMSSLKVTVSLHAARWHSEGGSLENLDRLHASWLIFGRHDDRFYCTVQDTQQLLSPTFSAHLVVQVTL